MRFSKYSEATTIILQCSIPQLQSLIINSPTTDYIDRTKAGKYLEF